MTEIIDLTPRGMLTPDGVKRVTTATEAFNDATFALASAATDFFHEQHVTLLEATRGVLLTEGDRAALRDGLHQFEVALIARAEKQDEFLRSVAGAPAIRQTQADVPVAEVKE